MRTIKKLLDLLTQQERKRAYLLLGMILVMALLEMICVASIIPFLAVLANPEIIPTNANPERRLPSSQPPSQHRHHRAVSVCAGHMLFVLLAVSVASKALTSATNNVSRINALVTFNIPPNLFAYYIALANNPDVDGPKGLAKSVTVIGYLHIKIYKK